MPVIGTRRRLQLIFDQLAGVLLTTIRHALEDMRGCLLARFNGLWVILADTRICLFEVDVDSYRLHIVQRVLLVEGEAEVSFGIEPRALNMFLDRMWVILTWCSLDIWVNGKHIRKDLEAILVADKAVEVALRRRVLMSDFLIQLFVSGVSAGTRLAIEVFFEFQLGVEAPLLCAEIHLLLHFLAGVGERGKTGIRREVGDSSDRAHTSRLIRGLAPLEAALSRVTRREWLFLVDENSLGAAGNRRRLRVDAHER